MIATEEVTGRQVPRSHLQAWARIAFGMFAVGWGANQFSPMLIVYRHELNLSAAAVAGLFAVYGATLIPALLIAGPLSDRYGRRPIVLPFVALSPIATLLLILGPWDLAIIAVGRALAGLCSGVVFGAATAWVQELSHGAGTRRAALALSAGFGLGPVVAAVLAQWAPSPLRVPYIPHLVLGVIAALLVLRTPEARASGIHKPSVPTLRVRSPGDAPASRRWPPRAVRTWRFWLGVAPAALLVFGSISVAIVVLPEDVTSAKTLSAGFAGLMTALSFAAGLGVQPLARRHPASVGLVAGLCSAVIGTGLGIAAVQDQNRALAGAAAVFLGATYGLCLVSGLRQAEELASATDRGAVLACYYVLAYLGFTAPYLDAGLGALAGKVGALVILTLAATVLALWTVSYAVWSRGWQRGHQ
jgi:MFS family permease